MLPRQAHAGECLDFGSLAAGALGLDDDNAVAAFGTIERGSVLHDADTLDVVGRDEGEGVVEMAVNCRDCVFRCGQDNTVDHIKGRDEVLIEWRPDT